MPIAAHKPGVSEKAAELAEKISKYAPREADDSDNAPGWKFAQWEMKGVPCVWYRPWADLERTSACWCAATPAKRSLSLWTSAGDRYPWHSWRPCARPLYQRALANREKRTWAATTMDEVKELAKANTGYIKTMWCGDLACAR